MPGVVAILTGADLLDIDPYWGHAIKDRPIVAIDRVRFAGEPVAAVAAVDEATAEAAVREIVVEYEELPVVGTLDEALAPDAPARPRRAASTGPVPRPGHAAGARRQHLLPLRHRPGRRRRPSSRRADIVVEGDYTFPGVYQYAMETHTVIAQWDADGITMWATCQHPFLVRAEIAALFDVPLGKVRVIVPYLGGGFGSKSYTKMEPITVALARKAGRPVKIVNSVEESMVTTRRHGAQIRMRTAADGTGRLLARDVVISFDTGAYADNGPRVTATGGDAAPGPYRWYAVRVDALCVYTNTAPSGSYRAFGASHVQWVGEMQVDEVARRAGIDALEMRRRNLLRPGEQVRPGGKPLDADLIGDIEKVAAALGWDDAKPADTGRGLSVGLLAAGAHPVSSAVVRLEADGEAIVLVGSTEMGQGQRTAFAQIAAEVLGDARRSASAASAPTPASRPTTAPPAPAAPRRSPGLAVQRAAQQVRADLLDIAALIWPGREADIELARRGGLVRRRAADLPGAHRQALRAVRRPAHRRGRRPPRGYRLVRRGAGLLGGLHRRRGGDASTARRARSR